MGGWCWNQRQNNYVTQISLLALTIINYSAYLAAGSAVRGILKYWHCHMTLVFNHYKLLVAIVNQGFVTGTLESTRNLLAGEELHKLFRYTVLNSSQVMSVLTLASRLATDSSYSLLYLSNSPLIMTTSEYLPSKQVPHRLPNL